MPLPLHVVTNMQCCCRMRLDFIFYFFVIIIIIVLLYIECFFSSPEIYIDVHLCQLAAMVQYSSWFYSHNYLCMLWLAKVQHGLIQFIVLSGKEGKNPLRCSVNFRMSNVCGTVDVIFPKAEYHHPTSLVARQDLVSVNISLRELVESG